VNCFFQRSEIDDFRFHDLIRHALAIWLAQAGVDLYRIAMFLGHMDIKMTQKHSHLYPKSLKEGVEVWIELAQISTIKGRGATGKPVTS
jgi:site-specific recombinase XerD